MRTTVDLPDDLHDLARHLAHQQHKTLSEVVSELIRSGLRQPATPADAPRTRGLPRITIGRAVTPVDVRTLEDEP